jgi:hypothetical protein
MQRSPGKLTRSPRNEGFSARKGGNVVVFAALADSARRLDCFEPNRGTQSLFVSGNRGNDQCSMVNCHMSSKVVTFLDAVRNVSTFDDI